MSEISSDNKFIIDGLDSHIFDFNDTMRDIILNAVFTAMAQRGRCIYVAGSDDKGLPHLFLSTDGSVWEERVITSRFGIISVEDYGRIVSILLSVENEPVYLIAENGYLITIPDCPKCVRARYVSDKRLMNGRLEDDYILVCDIEGNKSRYLINSAMGYRCAWDFAKPYLGNAGIVIDFRSENERKKLKLPCSINMPEEFLEKFLNKCSKSMYLFFICDHGYKADDAVNVARTNGFHNAYSLGGVGDVLLDFT